MPPISGTHDLWLGALLLFSIALRAQGRLILDTNANVTSLNSTIAQCTKVENTDFWGGDIAKLANVTSYQNCCNRCFKNKNCYRWTFSPITNRCWLKRSSGWTRRDSPDMISGKVIRTSSSPLLSSPKASGAAPVPTTPNTFPIPSDGSFSKSNYADVLGLSWMFYEAQRSGELPANYRVAWRKSAHTKDIIPGGWYDAGDYLKLNFPLASVVSLLSWGLLEFKSGYQQAGETQHALDNLYSAADYLKRCHIAPRKYIGQIGHPDTDHAFWGRPEQQKTARPAYVYDATMGASDLMGKVAAALASSSLVWRPINATFSADLLNHAKELYQWGTEKDGKYSSYYKSATASIYPSSDSADDMAWGAYWLYRATNDRTYLEDSVKYWKKKDWDVSADWDSSGASVAVALANLVEDGESVPSGAEIKKWVLNDFLGSWTKPSGEIRSTPQGMHHPKWSKWGNLQLSTTASFLSLAHAKHSTSSTVRREALQFARSQVDYAMGSSGRSFVVGYGVNPPLRVHHAGASCPDRPAKCDWPLFDTPKPNPQILYGALVSGPSGPGDDTYHDKRDDFVTNEVAVDYNSGFTSALAGLVDELSTRYCAKERQIIIDFKAGLAQQGRVDLAKQLVFNKKIAGGVSRKRPDGRVSSFTHSVILEADEKQALYVDPVRDALLAEGSQGNGAQSKPTAFLRLNPDGYRDSTGGYHESVFKPMHPVNLLPFVPIERMPDYQRRIQETVAAFIHLCDHRPAESTVQYLYFNGHEEEENAVPSANEL